MATSVSFKKGKTTYYRNLCWLARHKDLDEFLPKNIKQRSMILATMGIDSSSLMRQSIDTPNGLFLDEFTSLKLHAFTDKRLKLTLFVREWTTSEGRQRTAAEYTQHDET